MRRACAGGRPRRSSRRSLTIHRLSTLEPSILRDASRSIKLAERIIIKKHSDPPPQPTGSLKPFDLLVGEWTMVGTHPAFPSAVQGHSSFEWLREGALLVWHFEWERGGPPSALSVIGHDDSVEMCSMLYSDERGVARIYQMSLEGGLWKMWRDAPGFSQRVTGTFSDDGKHHYLSWRVVARWFTLGTEPGCDVHEKAIKGACVTMASIRRNQS